MYRVNDMLIKAVQNDRLRDAQQNRLARLIELRRRAMKKVYQRKDKSSNG